MMHLEPVVLCVTLCIVCSAVGAEDIVIRTDAGLFLGQIDESIEHNGERKSGKRFLGIPFAKPPVGDRRFMKPEVPDATETTYNATYYRPHCPQLDKDNPSVLLFGMDEDCLYLNVYVPGGEQTSRDTTFPVMIWIHGGAFRFGGANAYSGDVLSSFNDVIVVTFHYRMNVFGFLSDGKDLHGNYGLWDQKMAIEWVSKHIKSFGGDEGRITLFGESAGAASVIYHALNPSNEGLFHRIIAQSGSPLAQWAFQKNPAQSFQDFTKRANCNKGNSQQTLLCLRSLSVKELLSMIKLLDQFSPSIDGDFLKIDPVSLFMASSADARAALQHFESLDFLSGVNSKDGASIVTTFWASSMKQIGIDINIGVPKPFFDSIYVPKLLQAMFSSTNDNIVAITKAVLHLYTDWSNPNDTLRTRDHMIDMSSDIYFFVPAIKAAMRHADSKKKTYFYEFDHKPWVLPKPSWLQGAQHAMEIPYVFGLPDSMKVLVGLPPDQNVYKPAVEVALASEVMALWTNFAKTGNPTSPGVSGVPAWPAYDASSQSYLHISMNTTVQRRLAASRFAFWTEVVPSLQACPSGVCQPKCPVSATPGYVPPGSVYTYFVVIISLQYATIFASS